MKEAKERGSGGVKKDWEPRLTEARYLGQHARTGAMMGITADGIVCGRLRRRLPEAERWDETCWQDLKGVPRDLRPTCVPVLEVDVEAQAQPRQSEEKEGGRGLGKEQSQLGRETKCPEEECRRKEQHQHQHQRQMQQ